MTIHQTPVCEEVNGWTPIRDGDVYCSPKCGFKCTWEGYQAAIREADALCRELGTGWSPVVWENRKWYARAERGKTSVRYLGPEHGFWCNFLSEVKQWHGYGKTPREAVQLVMKSARADMLMLERELLSSGLVDEPRRVEAVDLVPLPAPTRKRAGRASKPVRPRVICSVCQREFVGMVPPGGDGTEIRPARHIGRDGNPCPGRWKPAETSRNRYLPDLSGPATCVDNGLCVGQKSKRAAGVCECSRCGHELHWTLNAWWRSDASYRPDPKPQIEDPDA